VAGYVVGAGYDQVTGLGSVDVARLLAAATSGAGDGTGSFTLAANPSTLSVTPVANTTTTSVWTLTATSVNGFAGTVGLSCAVTPASSQPPTCSVTPGSVSLAAGGAETATIAITSAGPTSNCLTAAARTGWLGGSGYGSGGAALAGLLLLVLPVRKRRGLRGLALVCLLAAGLGTMSGCSGSATTTACSNVVSAGTTAGTYTVTVTGISGTLTATAPVALTVTVN
jgi:hypothetical protein